MAKERQSPGSTPMATYLERRDDDEFAHMTVRLDPEQSAQFDRMQQGGKGTKLPSSLTSQPAFDISLALTVPEC